jgi:hypothetical protein
MWSALVEGYAAYGGYRSWAWCIYACITWQSKRQTPLFRLQVLAELPLTWLIRLKTQAPASFVHSFNTSEVSHVWFLLFISLLSDKP